MAGHLHKRGDIYWCLIKTGTCEVNQNQHKARPRRTRLGSTGHRPVPSGDPPDGTARDNYLRLRFLVNGVPRHYGRSRCIGNRNRRVACATHIKATRRAVAERRRVSDPAAILHRARPRFGSPSSFSCPGGPPVTASYGWLRHRNFITMPNLSRQAAGILPAVEPWLPARRKSRPIISRGPRFRSAPNFNS